MNKNIVLVLAMASTLVATNPASAQDPGSRSGEPEQLLLPRVEITGTVWATTPHAVVSSDLLTLGLGAQLDFNRDLGIGATRITEIRGLWRMRPRHVLRVSYLPITFAAESVLERSIVLAGRRFTFGLPVEGEVGWRSWGFGYEYDVIHGARGYVGVIGELRYARADATLSSIFIVADIATERAVFPVVGGVGRWQVARRVSLTGELRGMNVPEGLAGDYRGHYVDFDAYGTVSLTQYVALQAGYRAIDLAYTVREDAADVLLRGPYLTGVLRF